MAARRQAGRSARSLEMPRRRRWRRRAAAARPTPQLARPSSRRAGGAAHPRSRAFRPPLREKCVARVQRWERPAGSSCGALRRSLGCRGGRGRRVTTIAARSGAPRKSARPRRCPPACFFMHPRRAETCRASPASTFPFLLNPVESIYSSGERLAGGRQQGRWRRACSRVKQCTKVMGPAAGKRKNVEPYAGRWGKGCKATGPRVRHQGSHEAVRMQAAHWSTHAWAGWGAPVELRRAARNARGGGSAPAPHWVGICW